MVAVKRIKDLPVVTETTPGDKLVLDGATVRAIDIADFLIGVGYAATSTSSQTIGSSGSKVFTVQAGLSYSAGARVRAADAGAVSTNWMEGVVASYVGTTLTFTADKSAGSGTIADWVLNLAGQPGADGAGTGDVVGPASSVDGEIALFNSTSGKLIKRAVITGMLKAAAGVIAAAVAGTDFVKPDTATAFTAQQSSTIATLTDGATINWDVSTRQKAKVTLGGNRNFAAVTNAVEGTTYFLWVIQDATGTRIPTFTTTGAGSFDFGAAGVPTFTTTANKADLMCFEAISIGGTLKLRYAGIQKGFA